MYVVYHERYEEVYTSDPAASPGRIECIKSELEDSFQFVEPTLVSESDLRLVHSQSHIDWVKQRGLLYEIAVLAVGGALKASKLAMRGEPAFGLIRPPGHHASPDSCWGFCYFNNVAIAVEKLRREGVVKKALIVDIDLHYGDGTANFFASVPEVVYHHVGSVDRESFLSDLECFFASQKDSGIVAVSAGFDRHELDWGGLLRTEDYATIGKTAREYADEKCGGRVFAVLEGGYNHSVLGKNVKALLLGLE
ncbi:MAG: histone deacetylase family protein [Candidatus Bathyarchaeota archaeon]|nr:histone deacetylase family protein [Candidatus Bathyarchaeota archaeon]MDH5494121.1 histone deacetylase family protein [Candidatus Bathyarchaeota archaeon]